MLYALVAVSANYHALLLQTWQNNKTDSWREIYDLFRTLDPLFMGMHPPTTPGIYVWKGSYVIKQPKSVRLDAIVHWFDDWEEASANTIALFQSGLNPFCVERPRARQAPRPSLKLIQGAKT
jgi:hypothetical protein